MKDYYICRYNMNATHSFSGRESAHGHTFHISVYVERKSCEDLENDTTDMKIGSIDRLVKSFLHQYEGRYLNDMEPFSENGASVEDIGDFFYDQLAGLIDKTEFKLNRLDIAENPLFVYEVGDVAFHANNNREVIL